MGHSPSAHMKCTLCAGAKTYRVGKGVTIKCPACKGSGTAKDLLTASVAQALAAKVVRREAAAIADGAPTVLTFVVEGDPVGKERGRTFTKANASGSVITRTITPERTRTYEAAVKLAAQLAASRASWAWSASDAFTVILRIRHRHKGRHPDATNIFKAVEDACNGVLWNDDKWVLDGAFSKRWDPVRPRVEVEVRRRRAA